MRRPVCPMWVVALLFLGVIVSSMVLSLLDFLFRCAFRLIARILTLR